MNIRCYTSQDYQKLVELYKRSSQFLFDEVTDSERMLARKIERDPKSILLVEEGEKFIGSVSIIEDGRIALLFRLVVDKKYNNTAGVLQELSTKAEEILRRRGYTEVHNIGPTGDPKVSAERALLGFKKGKDYTWFWKTL